MTATHDSPESFNEELWYTIFAEGHPVLIEKHRNFRLQGEPPRCKLCLAPFGGDLDSSNPEQPGPSNRNPRYCSLCDVFIRENPGGAKVKLSMVFTDVRDSTRLSHELELREYVRLINHFYATTTSVFVETDGFLMDVVGDEVFAVYPTGFSGVTDDESTIADRETIAASKALDAAGRLVQVSENELPDAFSFGTAVHTAEVYIGTVRGAEEGIFDVRVWGPEVNKTARLSSAAAPGEALVSESTYELAGGELALDERRELELKGLAEKVMTRILRA